MSSYTEWLIFLQAAEKSSVIKDKLRKVHYKFQNNQEMVEEYDMDTGLVLRRAWKRGIELGGDGYWEFELGDPPPESVPQNTAQIFENPNEPIVTRRITKMNLEWRIRNLPYSIKTYNVTAEEDNTITVRTANKKYFKKLRVPELERASLKTEQSRISINHQFQTLIIIYKKPPGVIEMEQAVERMLQRVKTTGAGDGDTNCKPS